VHVLRSILKVDGVNVDFKDKKGNTALKYAARGGHDEVMRELVRAGAHVNTQDEFGCTALWDAANWANVSTVKLLLSTPDIDVNLHSVEKNDGSVSKGTTPLEQAMKKALDASNSAAWTAGYRDVICALQGFSELWRPLCFVSGGQTGADSIAFPVYRTLGISVQGYMPKGYKRDDGRGQEVAQKHGLMESDGGFGTRDRQNAAQSDACLGFLTTLPMTSRGTMQTARIFTHGKYEFVASDYQKPEVEDFLVIAPQKEGFRPVILFWDISEEKLHTFSSSLIQFLKEYTPSRLMLSGPLESTWPGMEELGAKLLTLTFANTPQEPGISKELCSDRP